MSELIKQLRKLQGTNPNNLFGQLADDVERLERDQRMGWHPRPSDRRPLLDHLWFTASVLLSGIALGWVLAQFWS